MLSLCLIHLSALVLENVAKRLQGQEALGIPEFVASLQGGGFQYLISWFSCFPSGTLRNPQPLVFSQKYRRYKWEAYCGTNRRRIAVQIGGVLRRFPISNFRSQQGTALQMGGVLRYKLEVYCQYFSENPPKNQKKSPTSLCRSAGRTCI